MKKMFAVSSPSWRNGRDPSVQYSHLACLWHAETTIFFYACSLQKNQIAFFLIWKKEKDTAYSFEKLLELILDSNQTNRDSRLFYLGKKHA